MAQPSFPFLNISDREKNAFIENTEDGGVDKRVSIRNPSDDPIPVTIVDAVEDTSSVVIYNLISPGADTEFFQALSGTIRKITIAAQGNSQLKFAFQMGGPYFTIPRGASYSVDNVKLVNGILYLQTSLAVETVEVLTWS